jgi:hypothetical protein
MGDAVEDRHPGELPVGDRRPDRLGEHRAVDDARDLDAEVVHQVADWQIAQALRGLVRAADGGGELLAGGLGHSQRLLGQREGSALHDRPLEQPAGAGRDQLGQDRQAAGRLAGDGDVVRVTAELYIVALDPAQGRLLVHQAVVAGRATQPGGAEGRHRRLPVGGAA